LRRKTTFQGNGLQSKITGFALINKNFCLFDTQAIAPIRKRNLFDIIKKTGQMVGWNTEFIRNLAELKVGI
jgi:hypothetical protein